MHHMRLCMVLLLTALLFVAASVPVRADAHDHSGARALTAADTLLSAPGAYYLGGDLTLPATLTVTAPDVTLCLNGYKLTAAAGNFVVEVRAGASLTVEDCFSPETHVGADFDHEYLSPRSEFAKPVTGTVTGGLVTGENARGVFHVTGGTLHLRGGTAAGGTATNGGGVFVERAANSVATVYLYDGAAVRDNAADVSGGGVYIPQACAGGLQMLGGEISGNRAVDSGGGVFVGLRGVTALRGGKICDNIQTKANSGATYGGGGVFLGRRTNLILAGVEISGNTAAARGGGVLASTGSTVTLSGALRITGNDGAGTDDDLTVCYAAGEVIAALRVADALASTASVGISYTDAALSTPVVLLTADPSYQGGLISSGDYDKFFSNMRTRSLLWDDRGQVSICVGVVHAVCGAVCQHGPVHPQVIFMPLPADFKGGVLAPGNYYPEVDLELTEPIVVKSGEVNFCLTGHAVRNQTGRVFRVEAGAALNLCDCYAPETHPGEGYTHSYREPMTKGQRSVTGGAVLGWHSSATPTGGVTVTGGTFRLYSGTIAGGSGQGGVYVTGNGACQIAGGTVTDCHNYSAGGGVFADASSRLNITGGNIRANRSWTKGGGVFAEYGFSISGEVHVVGNLVKGLENNVYLPRGMCIAVEGPVTGRVGVSMERAGVFTSGGASPYVHAFHADVGMFVEVQGAELGFSGLGIEAQPLPETRTVRMKSPDTVAAYQWYTLVSRALTDAEVTAGDCVYNAADGRWERSFAEETDSLACFAISLGAGDTLRVKAAAGLGSVFLTETMTSGGNSVQVTAALAATPDQEGWLNLTAPQAGAYTLRAAPAESAWHAGETLSLEIASFGAAAVADQTGATFTGEGGYQLCSIAYDDNVTVFYTEPFRPGTHGHAVCGAVCSHGGIHGDAVFMPIAATLSGALLEGPALRTDLTLTGGDYALFADLTLNGSLRIPAGVTARLCLNGHTLRCESASGIVVAGGGTLVLCDCQLVGSVRGNSSAFGGGMYLAGAATLYGGAFTGGSAEAGGGIYVAATGSLTIAGDVRIAGNEPDDLCLAPGRTVTLAPDLPSTLSVGIAMERLGVFTSGAAGGYLEQFFPNRHGTHIEQNAESGELYLRGASILRQPTAKKPSLEVDYPEGVEYQWYSAAGTPFTDENDPRCDIKKGTWQSNETGEICTLTLEAGTILRIVPGKKLPEGAVVAVSGKPLLQTESGEYLFTVALPGTYLLSYTCEEEFAAAFTVECYTVGEALEEQTRETLSAAPGAYLCHVLWPDGMEAWSQLVVLQKNNSRPMVWENPFTDVAMNDWYYEAIRIANENGWLMGVEEHLFAPELEVTRGMLMTVLWRLSGKPLGGELPFMDVAAEAWYNEPVRWAAAAKIACGLDAEHFAPELNVTREQTVTFLYRWAVSTEPPTDIENWSAEAVQWAVNSGLLLGTEEASFELQGTLNRAQLATLLTRLSHMER